MCEKQALYRGKVVDILGLVLHIFKKGKIVCAVFLNNATIPFYLILVNVVVNPIDSEGILVGIGMGVHHNKALGNKTVTVSYVNNVITLAVDSAVISCKQTVFESVVIIHFCHSLAVVEIVRLGVVITQGERPVYAQLFHQMTEQLVSKSVVYCACPGNGEGNIACNYYEIGLFCGDHRRHRVDCHFILVYTENAAGNMYVGDLKYLKIAIGDEIRHAILVIFGGKLIFVLNGRKGINILVHCSLVYSVCHSENKAKSRYT